MFAQQMLSATCSLSIVLLALSDVCVAQITPSGYRLEELVDENLLESKSEVFMETQELIAKHGYPVETHVVTTDDGYMLKLHRIPRGRATSNNTGIRPPVLIMHGLLAASDIWVLTGPNKALGYVLADDGYDVWLGNARGNYYSRQHVDLSPSEHKFWDFSWHEMGNSDLPAVIDYILNTTSQERLFYIGHSMGTTMFYALMATQPQYNDKIRLMVGLAPVAYNGRLRTTFGKFILPYTRNIIDGFFRSGQQEVLPRLRRYSQLADTTCAGMVGQALCMSVYFSVFGIDRKQLNATLLPTYWSHLLSGTSVNTVNHFIENHKANEFQWYDRTRQRRKMPLYNISRITAPVSLHYALNDALLHPDAVMRLSKQLPNLVEIIKLPDDQANHIDFALAIEAKELVYDDVLRLMRKY